MSNLCCKVFIWSIYLQIELYEFANIIKHFHIKVTLPPSRWDRRRPCACLWLGGWRWPHTPALWSLPRKRFAWSTCNPTRIKLLSSSEKDEGNGVCCITCGSRTTTYLFSYTTSMATSPHPVLEASTVRSQFEQEDRWGCVWKMLTGECERLAGLCSSCVVLIRNLRMRRR